MILIKALLAGIAGVSLCMANISGIVTDTGTTPVSGAVVQFEKAGRTATTGTDGRFTIDFSTALLHGSGKLFSIGLTAGISGNTVHLTIAEQSIVEVATFDLTGKTLSTMRRSMPAGSHSLSLPYRGVGIFLCKVISGNRMSVLKGNAVSGISYGSSATSQGSPSNSMVKQTKTFAAINNVIAVTKAGYLNYRAVVRNSDTSGLTLKMIANAGTLTDTDGNAYQTVRIGNQVWMAENLRVTKYNDGSAITQAADGDMWNGKTTPVFCYYRNTTNADSIKQFGALYNWYVVSPANSRKIAPTGWHVPSDAEWDTLQSYLIVKGYNWDGTAAGDKIAKSLAAKTDWSRDTTAGAIGCGLSKNNTVGFSALPGGYRSGNGSFYYGGLGIDWWSSVENGVSSAWNRYLYYGLDGLLRNDLGKSFGCSVRLLKD